MSSKFGKYGEMNTGFTGDDVRGFIQDIRQPDFNWHQQFKKITMAIKAGIIGGAGYTGGELIRLLIHHPDVAVSFIHSRSNAGKSVHTVHQDLVVILT
jgi:hypothetical protein